MQRTATIDSRRKRLAFAREAGFGRVSAMSVLAGTLVAYAAFTVLLAAAGAVLAAFGVTPDGLSRSEWRDLGMGGGAAVLIVMLLAYLFGGYVAGRMARRSGALNGFLVFLLSTLIGVIAVGVVALQADAGTIVRSLRSFGVPTTAWDFTTVGIVAAAASLVVMLAGAVLGGFLGDRWHGKLASRAADPSVGVEPPLVEGRHRRDARDERGRGEPMEVSDDATIDVRERAPSEAESTSGRPREHADR